MKTFMGAVIITGMSVSGSAGALAQNAGSATGGSVVPEVEVQQQPPVTSPKPATAAKPAPKPQQQPAPASIPAPVPPPLAENLPSANPTSILPNSPYGSPAGTGAAERAAQSATTPVNPTQLIPSNLQGFSGAATDLTPQVLEENQPRNVNEALTRVPGVIVINDDANAQHGGIGIRGSPARRSRKVLVMEDGHANNLALWLDPSVHYWGPIERFESIEVIRGTVVTQGPNNNFGVVNARNLSPFGPNESVVSGAIGFTETDRGFFEGEDDDVRSGSDDIDLSYRWHVHTRQMVDNVGLVLSYTGANVQGGWDTEQLRFNDFYGSLGFKGSSSDLVVTASYARQRDNYDEQNFLGEIEGEQAASSAEEAAELFAEANKGAAERAFFNLQHCKTCFAPASGQNTYNGDIWRGQIIHNSYLDEDTTVTSRVYAGYHRRDRYQTITTEAFTENAGAPGSAPAGPFDFEDGGEDIGEGYIFDANTMFGRLRTFRHVGGEVRAEWANRSIFGYKQDIQAGIRYEYQDMTNRNFLGINDEVLKEGDESGATLFDRSLESNAVSAFLQTNVSVAQDFNVVPGIRFEWYKVRRQNRVVAEEESEAEGYDGEVPGIDDCGAAGFSDECLSVAGLNFDAVPNESYDTFVPLPGISFAYTGFKNTTIFGGYFRGLSTGVLRNEDFPAPDEIGNNFNLGFRSNAIKGVAFEAVGFYQLIENYQFGSSFSDASDRSFGRADEVEISGVELFGRLNSQPYTGGPLNFFGEANYTYSRGVFKDADEFNDDGEVVGNFNGNRIPEVPQHVAALTLGVEQRTGWRWDASVTYTYRGAFFTDEANTGFGEYEAECDDGPGPGVYECEIEEAGEDGEVPSVWLLSARANLELGNSGASVFVSGDNLTNELYISDREDGLKPGLGRTFWTGFKYKF